MKRLIGEELISFIYQRAKDFGGPMAGGNCSLFVCRVENQVLDIAEFASGTSSATFGLRS